MGSDILLKDVQTLRQYGVGDDVVDGYFGFAITPVMTVMVFGS